MSLYFRAIFWHIRPSQTHKYVELLPVPVHRSDPSERGAGSSVSAPIPCNRLGTASVAQGPSPKSPSYDLCWQTGEETSRNCIYGLATLWGQKVPASSIFPSEVSPASPQDTNTAISIYGDQASTKGWERLPSTGNIPFGLALVQNSMFFRHLPNSLPRILPQAQKCTGSECGKLPFYSEEVQRNSTKQASHLNWICPL